METSSDLQSFRQGLIVVDAVNAERQWRRRDVLLGDGFVHGGGRGECRKAMETDFVMRHFLTGVCGGRGECRKAMETPTPSPTRHRPRHPVVDAVNAERQWRLFAGDALGGEAAEVVDAVNAERQWRPCFENWLSTIPDRVWWTR